MFANRIAGIRSKIEIASKIPGAMNCFGANKHRYRLNPPAAESDVEAFESRHGIRFPEDYRQFLLLGGNGGAGPYYGLATLGEEEWFEEESEAPGYYATPCPMAYSLSIRPDWSEHLPENTHQWGAGSIHICDQGCTYVARLVITGESRGRIVNLDMERSSAPYFVKDECFLDWYEQWVDELIELQGSRPIYWFGFDNPAYDR